VNTGVVDPLAKLADVAQEHGCCSSGRGLWCRRCPLPELRRCTRDRAGRFGRARSHKWLYVPYEAGATLVRDPATLRAMFAHRAEYLALEQDSYLEGPVWISDLGPQLTREFGRSRCGR